MVHETVGWAHFNAMVHVFSCVPMYFQMVHFGYQSLMVTKVHHFKTWCTFVRDMVHLGGALCPVFVSFNLLGIQIIL